MARIQTHQYRSNAAAAIKDQRLQRALSTMQDRLVPSMATAYDNLPEGPSLRKKGHELRRFAIEHLDILLPALADKIRQNGGHVFFAQDAAQAVDYCLSVAKKNHVKTVVKGKSMISDEIGLNAVLESNGIEVSETDLGEYIVQIAGETPSHILAPAIHKTRKEIAALFQEKLGIEYNEDPETLTKAARKALRQKFLTADMGISGCNIACAQTGHITTVSNEGNIRMSTTLPKIHLVFMGMERITARLEDHDALFRLLATGAASQSMAGYVSYVGGPRTPDQLDGPDQFHLVILDNGRSKILADPVFREALYCVRCGACLNVCPVYGKIGGHAYGYPYSGPIGAVITPLLVGIDRAKDLSMGETLCGACKDACPMQIDLPRMLLELRSKISQGDTKWESTPSSRIENFLFSIWALINRNRRLYTAVLKAAAIMQKWLPRRNGMIRTLPFLMKNWSRDRDMMPIADISFLSAWKKTHPKPKGQKK